MSDWFSMSVGRETEMTIQRRIRAARQWVALVVAVSIAPAFSAVDDTFSYAGELSGLWSDRTFGRDGVTIEVLDNRTALVFWMTYRPSGEQAWVIGQGPVTGNRIEIEEARITDGGRFGEPFPPEDVGIEIWGKISIEFHGCSSATMEYVGPAGFGSGTQQLERLSSIDGRNCDDRRSFRMGFTPFPPDLPDAEGQPVVELYARLGENGDLIAHHFDDGIPWPEAAAGGGVDSYHPNLRGDWEFRRSLTPAGHEVFVSITPIGISRDALAPYRGAEPDTPRATLGPPWADAAFDDPEVVAAFTRHAINTVEFFRPDYLAIGIEVNLLAELAPDQWGAYLSLHRQTWAELHSRYPSLPVLLSVTAHDLLPGITNADPERQAEALADVLPHTDILGVSFYPFLSALGTEPLPEDFLARIDALTRKPIAITETGFPAQMQQLSFPTGDGSFDLDLAGTETGQADFIERLLAAAERFDFRFVVNFVAQDYDALCDAIQCSDLDLLWRDTGLWDEQGAPRPALQVWRDQLAREIIK